MDTAVAALHVLAAAVWVGGTVALVFVAVPVAKRLTGEARAAALGEPQTARRPLVLVGWASFTLTAAVPVLGVVLAHLGLG